MPVIITALLLTLFAPFAYGRDLPSRALSAPDTISSEMQPIIAAEPPAHWNSHPVTREDWTRFREERARANAALVPDLLSEYAVSSKEAKLGGVPVYYLSPKDNLHPGMILLHIHGGGYVLNPGIAGIGEGILMAGINHIDVVSVDYRLAPQFPFPAALDDCVAAYKGLLEKYRPENIGVFGTSTGGGLALSLLLRLRSDHLPLPAAVAALTPWTELARKGDSYQTNDGVDNVLTSYNGWLEDAAKAYAGSASMEDPLISPIYGDFSGMPPVLLVSGTRDLFLSNTIRMHQKLREAGNLADLLIYEGQSHAQYNLAPKSPEGQFHFGELKRFFNRYLGK